MDTTYFPFDEQTCELQFSSLSHDKTQMKLQNSYGRDEADLSTFVRNEVSMIIA